MFWLGVVALVVVVIVAFSTTKGTTASDQPQPDRSGITVGSGSDLVALAPGTMTKDDYGAAQKAEPFAVQLADNVNQNRLGINFVWTLVAGFLVIFM